MRTALRAVAGAFVLTTAVAIHQAGAETAYPGIGEPVLSEDSRFTPTEWGYARDDYLAAAEAEAGNDWPTAFYMEGYAGASRGQGPNAYLRMGDGELMALRIRFGTGGPDGAYVEVNASIRGTECSGGHFDLYDRRHAWDGHHIIEWLADQPWSNGSVGMYGSSYPGQTGYWVAATQPPSLKAVSANLLHSDIYRDIFMPGGIQNILFPSVWTYGLGVIAGPHRIPVDSLEDGFIPDDEICTQAQLTRYSVGDLPQPQNEPAWAAIRSVDDHWYTGHAALTYAPAIKIPYHQQNNWQDEQTGPRAVVLFHHIHPDPVTIQQPDGQGGFEDVTVIPKKYALPSGDHGHGGYASRDRWTFFDIFVRGLPDTTGFFQNPDSEGRATNTVVNYFEAESDGSAVATKSGRSWPFEGTEWQKWYVHENGVLDRNAPSGTEATDTYFSGVARHGFFQFTGTTGSEAMMARGYPDEVIYESATLDDPLVIAGPIQMDLYASMVGTDAHFYVALYDVDLDGNMSFIQRGLLKASHRAIDPNRSYYVDTEIVDGELRGPVSFNGLGRDYEGDVDDLLMVQPYRPHTNPQPVFPGDVVKYRIEIFPVGHIFREGHKLMIRIHTPPAVERLWGYTPSHPPAVVTLHHDVDHPSYIQLPVVEVDDPSDLDELEERCAVPDGFPCFTPSPLDLEP